MDYEALTGAEKVAIIILSMPDELMEQFLAELEDDEVQKALSAISRMDDVPPRVQKLVLSEFRETLGSASEETLRGGRKMALSLVDKLSDERAARVLEELGRDELRVDWTLRSYQPDFIAERIRNEHPQTIALILSQLPSDRGGKVIESLDEAVRSEIVLRLANMDVVTTEVIADLELGLAELFERKPVSTSRVGGYGAAAGLLNRVDADATSAILEDVDTRDTEAARAIRKRMLTFDDLINIDRRGFQALLREIATEDLAVALKTASEEMRDSVFENLSSRAADQIKEEIDLLGMMKLADVERVQEEIVEAARRLESEGRLSIDVGGGDDVFV